MNRWCGLSRVRIVGIALTCTSYVVLMFVGSIGCAPTRLAPIDGDRFALARDERTLWNDAARSDEALAASGLVLADAALDEYVNATAMRLLPHLGAADAGVRVRVVKDPLLNAFAFPNGSLYVHSGLLAAIDNEAQLAVILGHELAHYLRRHALREKRSEENRLTIARIIVGILAVGAAAGGDGQLVMQVLQQGNSAAKESVARQIQGYARDLEREADGLALEAMAAAGYAPAEAEGVFQALAAHAHEESFGEPYFFGSHPLLSERIANTREFARLVEPAPDAVVGREPYEARIADLLLINAELDLAVGRPQRALRAVLRHLQAQPENAAGHLLHGRVLRRLGDDPAQLAAAAEAFEIAIRLDPNNGAAFRELAMTQRVRGVSDAARNSFRRFLEISPDAVDRPIIESYIEEGME